MAFEAIGGGGAATAGLIGCLAGVGDLTFAALFVAGFGKTTASFAGVFFAGRVGALLAGGAVFDLVALRAGALSAAVRLLSVLILADLPLNGRFFIEGLAEADALEVLLCEEGLFRPFVTGSLMKASIFSEARADKDKPGGHA